MKIFIRPRKCFLLTAFLFFLILSSKFSFAQTDLCGGAPLIPSSPAPGSCTAGTILGTATYLAGGGVPGCGGANNDVWFKFVAASTNPLITYTAGTLVNGRIQLFSGLCGAQTSLLCGTNSIFSTGLTIGVTYYVRIYSTTNATGTFTICVVDPPANDLCANAVSLTNSGSTCTSATGSVLNAARDGAATDCAAAAVTYDVWYKFVAQSTNPTISATIGASGSNFTVAKMQLFSGACGGLASISCNTALPNPGTAGITAAGLTIGNTYYIRMYASNAVPATNGTFTICVTDPAPANDNCGAPVALTSSTTCVNTAGNVIGATLTAPVPAPACGAPVYDVWYRFTAQTTNPTITISSNTNFANPRIQLLTGACGGFTNVTCSNTGVLAATGLAIGTVYFVRVYSTSALPTTNGTFNICVTDPAPANDDCGGAITLTPGATCTNTQGNVIGATLSSPVPLPGCGTPVYDVWYKFIAVSPVQTVSISSPTAPASMASFINQGIQVLSGACGSLFNVACSNAATPASVTATGLTVGNTYYARVYSTSAAPTSNGAFNICVLNAPANDDCSGAISLTSSTTCNNLINQTLVNATNVALPNTCAALTGTRKDVWYTFTAQATNPTITITTAVANPRFEILSGTCGSLTSKFCSTSGNQAASGLTIGTTYFVRVYSNTDASGTFSICVKDPVPANDLCAGAPTLTSATVCNNITGTMYGATLTAITVNGDCAVTPAYDVWYKFTAQTTNPTINLSNIGVNFTNPAMELLSNNCGGTFTAIQCGTTSIAANYLTPNTIYYIRVYSSSGTAPTAYAGSAFDICVVDPVATPPFNDDCANAINLPIWNNCNNVAGSVAGATPSTAPGLAAPCAGTVTYDVWYKFTAVTTTANTISLSTLGPNFTSSGIQVFSGTCGSLTSVACNTGTSVTTPALTVGTVYYIRVFSTAASVPNGNARFNICAQTTNAPVRSGNSYVNVSKKTAGGVIEPGDTLEIRFTVNHTSGIMTNLRFVDNVPSKTSMLVTSNDSIRIITNEGLTSRRYTPDATDADAAVYKASPLAGEYNIRLNLGFPSGAAPNKPTTFTNSAVSANGQMDAAAAGDRPRGGGGMLFAISYRVKVTGVPGDTVKLFPGQFIYNPGSGDVTLTATPFNILISNPLNLCANSIGLNNAVENGGTFGSGNTLNRSYDLTTPIAGYTFLPDVSAYNGVGDGRYAIVNNMSPKSDPVRTARRQPNCNVPATLAVNDPLNCNNRMHGGHWDIDGDHTGTNNAIGNIPPDSTTPSGYMLEVNADYVASEVYRQTVANLCPNTYYEFSAWVRNICKTCGIDSAGQQFTNSVAGVPAPPPNGYPGVLPNLTFTLNDLDYYNTGTIDTVGWLKKGFVFKTGPTQKTATFSIRNNAQGGGGNDWTLDDIAIATCLPSMMYSPSINPAICQGNSLQINDTVRSYFNNYTHYKWQRSTDGGNNWNDVTTNHDTTLAFNGSIYQFMTTYTIPSAHTTLADSGDLYRVVVATLDSNLSNSACLFTDASTIITLKVLDCGVPLGIDFISFSGKLNHGNADLIWTTSKENEPVSYSVERSYDGINFTSITILPGNNNVNAANNTYKYTDLNIQGKVWYRIAMINKDGHKKYSRIIILEDKTVKFGLTSVINPFATKLDFGITVSENSRIDATLISISGKPVRKESFNVYEGANSLTINDTETLPAGMYILQIKNKDQIINKKVMKK